ncbi:MAG: helix-turn-helix transcriptional regulator [bacterium]|nr:helix-turn-helix transcriptional regulator [bacterium]
MAKKPLQPFAKRIRAFRQERKISQAELAKKADVSNITISKIESGDNGNPTILTLKNIASVLKVSIVELVK